MNKEKAVFMLATLFFWFSIYAYVPELSTFAEDLGASYKMIGTITASYGFTQLILRIPFGITSDKLNKRKIFIEFGLALSIVSSLITFLNPSIMSLLITRMLAGVSACTWIMFTVMFSSYFKQSETSKAIGIINACNSTGQIIAMLIGGVISLKYGPRYLFLLSAIGASIGLFFSLFIYEKNVVREPLKVIDIINVAKNKTLILVSILAILSQFITFSTAFGFVPTIAKSLGANSFELSMLSIINIIPSIFVPPFVASLIINKKSITHKKVIITGFTISVITCIIVPFIHSLNLLFGVQFLAGIGRAMVFPLLMGLSIQDVVEEKRATAMGFFQAIYGVGMVTGPLLLGSVGDAFGLTIGFIVTALFGILAIVITSQVKRS